MLKNVEKMNKKGGSKDSPKGGIHCFVLFCLKNQVEYFWYKERN